MEQQRDFVGKNPEFEFELLIFGLSHGAKINNKWLGQIRHHENTTERNGGGNNGDKWG